MDFKSHGEHYLSCFICRNCVAVWSYINTVKCSSCVMCPDSSVLSWSSLEWLQWRYSYMVYLTFGKVAHACFASCQKVAYLNIWNVKHGYLNLSAKCWLDNLQLPSLTKLHHSPKPVTITFVNFAVSGLTSIRQLPVPLLPLSSTPNLITVFLSTINSLSLNYPGSNWSRTLARTVVNVPKSSPVISLPSYALSTSPLAQNHWTHRI